MGLLPSSSILDELFSPWVLRTAWNKVQSWYASGELYDPAEYLAWQADPWGHLQVLAAELKHPDGYRPHLFPLIPYPKKGDRTRHYTMPTVGDQVAFMVFLVLLGPFLEACMPNVSFGNRLYRPRIRHNDRWYRAPFSLNQSRVYEPFSRGYRLFRNVMQSIATRAVYMDFPTKAAREDPCESPDRLPYKGKLHEPPERLIYARLDLSLAFPSVDRACLRDHLKVLVTESTSPTAQYGGSEPNDEPESLNWGRPSFPDLLVNSRGETPFASWVEAQRTLPGNHSVAGQPWDLLMKSQDLRVYLADRLADMIDKVTYDPWPEPKAWDSRDITAPRAFLTTDGSILGKDEGPSRGEDSSPHSQFDTLGLWPIDCHLPPKYLQTLQFGLPTGLAISGWLLNVVLTTVDEAMCRRYEELLSQRKHLYYLRFADDMVLFASDPEVLEQGLRFLRSKLRGASNHFRLAADKAKPDSVKGFLQHLYGEEDRNSDLEGLGRRLKVRADNYLARTNVHRFVTKMVEEVSDLASETLEESFGAAGLDRLNSLIDLALRNDDDTEIGEDARLSFAVGRMARAAWPRPSEYVLEDGRAVDSREFVNEVLATAERSIRSHPWRFKLWRHVLIIALRATRYGERQKTWLFEHILPFLRWSNGYGDNQGTAWEQGNEEEAPDADRAPDGVSTEKLAECKMKRSAWARRTQHRRLRTSFHRAFFWNQWASCIKALRRVALGQTVADPTSWLSHFEPNEAQAALEWIGNFGRLASGLYSTPESGYWPNNRPFLWWWETQAVQAALLAASDPTPQRLEHLGAPRPGILRLPQLWIADVAYKLRKSPEGNQLKQAIKNSLQPRTSEGLTPSFRLWSESEKRLAVVWVSSFQNSPKRLQKLFASSHLDGLAPRLDQDAVLWAALARFGLWESWLDIQKLRPCGEPPLVATTLWSRLELLDIYGGIRRLCLAHGQTLQWGAFSQWFPRLPQSDRRGERPSTTLLESMYRFHNQQAPPDAEVPALEAPAPIAYAVATLTLRFVSGPDEPFISPDTVVLKAQAYDHLVRSRAAAVALGTPLDQNGRNQTKRSQDVERDVIDPLVQFLRIRDKGSGTIEDVTPLCPDSRAPHPLFLFPNVVLDANESTRAAWQSAVLMLWMLAGGEELIDQVYRVTPWHISLPERDDIRCRYVLPESMWVFIESALGSIHVRAKPPGLEMSEWEDFLKSDAGISGSDSLERIKIRDIAFIGGDWHVVSPGEAPESGFEHVKDLRVRMVQAVRQPAEPNPNNLKLWAEALAEVPSTISREMLEPISVELADRLLEARTLARLPVQNRASDGSAVQFRQPDHIVIFPEWYTPYQHVRRLRQFVQETGIAVLSGVLLRELPRAVPAISTVRRRGLRLVVNEAVLILPNAQPTSKAEKKDPWSKRKSEAHPMPTRVYSFWIRKPYPAANELGLVRYLQSSSKTGAQWAFAQGIHWYRWTYRDWGSFSVSICSDILDTFVWDWLRGRIQHLFVPAWNKDIDLFDQITWTRGYELYANVATVNHGSDGGSVAWTPKKEHKKEVFRVHGPNQGLAVTVNLPVSGLVEAQEDALAHSIERRSQEWGLPAPDSPETAEQKRLNEFKSPAPNYRRR